MFCWAFSFEDDETNILFTTFSFDYDSPNMLEGVLPTEYAIFNIPTFAVIYNSWRVVDSVLHIW